MIAKKSEIRSTDTITKEVKHVIAILNKKKKNEISKIEQYN